MSASERVPTGYLVIKEKGGAMWPDMPAAVGMPHVPRVGETIEVGRWVKMPPRRYGYATVVSVIYQVHDAVLVPLVTAQLLRDRAGVLEERGWLGSEPIDGLVQDHDDDRDLPLPV